MTGFTTLWFDMTEENLNHWISDAGKDIDTAHCRKDNKQYFRVEATQCLPTRIVDTYGRTVWPTT